MSFWKAEARSMIPGDWGDFGDILQHGMSMHQRRREGRIALERTGPFIAPITMPFEIVLTSEARASPEQSGLTGYSFTPVEKARVVELRWENWDLSAREPAEYPETGEPEGYILERPHNPAVADALGDLWEIAVAPSLTVFRSQPIVKSFKELWIDPSTWNGEDLVKSRNYGSILFSQRARDWFSQNWGEYLSFEQFPSQ